MMKRLKEEGRAALCFLKDQHRRSTALLLVFCMILTMVPKFALKADAVSNGYVRTTVLNLSSTSLTYQTSTGETATANPTAQDITDTGEGWAWYKNVNAEKGYGANTLELNNANINVSTAGGLGGATSAESRAISATISDGLNIVVIGDNNLSSANGQVVANSYVSAMVTYYPLTIKSTTNGTLNLHENATNMSAVVAGGLTTDHVNFNIDCSSQSNSALNSTYSSNNNGAPLVFDGGTATLRGNTGYSNAGLRGSSVSIKGGAVLTCSGEYGINGSSISIEDGMIHSTGNNRAFATNPSLGTGLFAIDNANNVLLPSTTDLTGYKDVVISSQNTDMSVTVNSDTPDEDLAVSAYSGNISIPLTKTDDNQYTGKIASGTYGLKVNGIDTGASFTASSSNNKIDIDVYKLSLAAGTGISGVSGAGYYVAGAKVNIGATANTDSVFSKWTSSNSALAPNMSTANTSVTMPASSMKFTATGITKGSSAVTLNKPVFTNNKSGYTFKSAVISNLTGVKSITFSITNGTTVQSVPTFLTPTSKLESIHGDTRTFTYVFAGGVTVSQAEEFIRGIVFNYVAGAEISVTVDDNATNLPDGAKITKFTPSGDTADHYYMYVENQLTWNDAYNQAKSFRYMGMVGYLATITSQEEDTVLDNISMAGGWSGGSRYTDSSDGTTAPAVNGAKDEYFKWSCGPEHGQNYYQYNAPDSKGPESGAYNGFKDAGEPNNYNTESTPRASGDYEWCMQIHFPSVASSTKYTWNDLSATNTGGIAGYFVEFSNYPGGMDNDYSSSKTATGSYSLAADGGVEEPATVTLNSPAYGSNDSVFSFPNAELKNISTIYSLTIKLDNYTNVLSKPSAPTVTNELTNIAGATNTITYQFESGISPDDAQSFLRGLQFRYGGLTDDSATNVSVTVDGNKTNLPAVASITEFNGHYYMYVDDCLSWTDAYNKAKTYTYMGLVGYLATITSAEEDKVLDNISMNGAWSAGTRHTGSYDLATAPSGTPQNNPYFIWACGPEAGTQYYYNNSTAVNGAYSGFFDKNEPNGSITSPNSECCMQVHYKGNSSSPMTWNDLCDRIYNGSGQEPKVGYFVEFSDYDGGRADGYSQSANGKSTVPISVKKGDVFSTVKNGETYYVDTVLKAYDRNISNITVNNSAFTSGDKLPGNLNTTYTVKASDLDGNTATTTVTMKTIASISEPISGLTVDNVQMSDKDSILAVKAALMAINTTDASADQKTEIANAIQNCKDLYFALFNATASPANGTNGWYKSGMGDITLTAPDGFTVSASPSGAWTGSIAVDSADGADKTATYYLKDTSTGDVSGVKAFNYKVDTAAPSTPVISYGTNNFKELLNALTFGLFFNDTVTVTLSASDTGSGVKGFTYTIGGTEYTSAATAGSTSFDIPAPYKGNISGVKAIDNAGNESAQNATEYFAVDNQTPAAPTVDTNGYTSGTWTKGDVKITVSGASATSGIAKYQYSKGNDATWYDMTTTQENDTTVTEPYNAGKAELTIGTDCNAVNYRFRAVSNAGNCGTPSEATIVGIDKAAPVISSVDGNPSAWTNNDATLTVTAGDSSSGLAAEPYSFDGGESWQASKSKSFASNQTVSIAVKDNAGNISAVTTVDITKIDKAVPSTPSVSYGTNNFKELLNSLTFGLFFNDTVTVTLSASDTGSGVKEFSYTIGGTEYTSAAAGGITSFDIPAPYKGNISGVKAVDNAGNESAQSATEYFAVDNQAPDAPTVDTNGYASGTWAKSTVTLTASGASATSGIAKYQYSADNGATWSDMTTEDETDATDTSPYNCVDAELAISNDRNGPILLRAVSNSGIKGEAASVSVKRDSVTPKLAVNVTGTVGQWTDTPVTFTLANSANNISPVAYWVKIGSGEWTQLSGNTCNVTGNVNTTYQFKAVSGSGLTSPLSNAYTVKLASDALKEVIKNIDSLPDPDIASDKQITDNEQLIKDTKILYDTLSRDEQSAVGQSRVDKLNKLISRLNALLVIIPKDTNTGITAGNIGTSVQIPELNDPGVSKVVVRLAVSPVNSFGAQNTNIAIASARLDQTGTNLVAAFDVSLIKSVFDSAGNETDTGKVSNSNIKDPITIRIPVPANYKGRTDLQVVYIDDSGNVTPLTTTLVVVDGVQYLQFTTTHFSVYAVTAPAKTPSTPNPNTGDRSLPMGIMPFFVFAILSVSATILLRRRKKKRGSSK